MYMSLFVTRDNQTLLWNIVNKNQKINLVFNGSEHDKQEWFKDIIREFHQSGNDVYNMVQLKELNKHVLQYMSQDVKNRLYQLQMREQMQEQSQEQSQEQYNLPNNQGNMLQNTPHHTPYSNISDESQNDMSDYERREQEYRKLLEKPQPKEIDFSDSTNNSGSMSSQEMESKIKERQNDSISIKNPLAEENKLLNDRISKMQTLVDTMQTTINSILKDHEHIKSEMNQMLVKQEVSSAMNSVLSNLTTS